jgi:hypothetical protein
LASNIETISVGQTAKLINPDRPEWVAGNPNDRSIRGFRIRHGTSRGPMSASFYNRLKKAGRGPKESYVDGKVFISVENEEAWDRARSDPSGTEAKLIAKMKAMRHRRALKAGRASAASAKHVSKQGPRKRAQTPPTKQARKE